MNNMIAASSGYVSSFQLMTLRYDGYVLIEYVRNYVVPLLKQQHHCFPYHNLYRAELIVDTINDLAGHHSLDEENYAALVISVYLVEFGHVKNPLDPYKQSVDTCTRLLQRGAASLSLVRKIQSCIRAIQNPSCVKDGIAQLFCDASFAHWSTISFQQHFERMREERELLSGTQISRAEWTAKCIRMVLGYCFKTTRAREMFSHGKRNNLLRLMEEEPCIFDKNSCNQSKKDGN